MAVTLQEATISIRTGMPEVAKKVWPTGAVGKPARARNATIARCAGEPGARIAMGGW
ncbi:hypothetical protein GCM10028796_48250 [Ramlibacter monticola]